MNSLRNLGLALIGAFALAGSAQAGGADGRPIKIDVNCRFNIRCGPSYMLPPDMAPWYLWFPNEPPPAMQTAQTSPYPNWPTTWPPAGTPGVPGAPPMRMPTRSQAPFGGDMTGSGFQPTGYQAQPQMPAYWYGR